MNSQSRQWLPAMICVGVWLFPHPHAASGQTIDWRKLHADALVMDGHADTPFSIMRTGGKFRDRSGVGHVDIPRLRRGGLDASFQALWIPPSDTPEGYIKTTLQLIDLVYRAVDENPDDLAIATSPDEILRVNRAGKIALLLGVEGGHAIEDDLAALRMFYRLGVRYMTLTWSFSHNWADSSGDKGRWMGLTPFGEDVVREMNRLGMMVDISHASDETFWDALRVSSKPMIASHSSCRALCGAARNMTDEMIEALAAKGGVVLVNFYSGFLDERYRKESARLRHTSKKALGELAVKHMHDQDRLPYETWRISQAVADQIERPPLSALIDHIEHVIEVAGVDHVGLGSDFDGVTSLPKEMDDVSMLPNITRELVKRGHTATDIRKILGGNFMRVFRAAGVEPE